MLFWIVATGLVMIAMMAVFLPLLRAPKADATRDALQRALAAELAEIEAERGSRFASAIEADAARAEVARRLLALDKTTEAAVQPTRPQWLFGFALLPILAVPLYLSLGAPEYPDQHFATRADRGQIDQQREMDALVARVEARLRDVPDDARGWALIAPVYAGMGRTDDALNAYAQAITHFNGDAKEKSALIASRGELQVALAGGRVTPEAGAAFSQAIALDANNEKALFYDALRVEQTSADNAEAKAAWQALIDRFAAANPGWLATARERLAALNAPQPAAPEMAGTGPTPEQVEAAAAMSDADQRAMIEGMVAQLAEKLEANPNDAQGWARLIRSRIVLGQRDEAAQALAAARGHFAEGTEDRTKLDSFAASLGL
ncbi:MAG: c-type cytochrome biogenesis protein CcmI [Rhizobiaceae bacterium]|nr:c-type cytochrome biogenesis protein CcmI [Rhizobiaceae bacterium]